MYRIQLFIFFFAHFAVCSSLSERWEQRMKQTTHHFDVDFDTFYLLLRLLFGRIVIMNQPFTHWKHNVEWQQVTAPEIHTIQLLLWRVDAHMMGCISFRCGVHGFYHYSGSFEIPLSIRLNSIHLLHLEFGQFFRMNWQLLTHLRRNFTVFFYLPSSVRQKPAIRRE